MIKGASKNVYCEQCEKDITNTAHTVITDASGKVLHYCIRHRPKKILCMFDYGPGINTGFSVVGNQLKAGLKAIFGEYLQLHICALNYAGPQYTEEDGTRVYSAYWSNNEQGFDEFGRIEFANTLKNEALNGVPYDGIFVLQDIGTILPFVPLWKSIQDENKRFNRGNFKSIFYFPVDAPIHAEMLRHIDWFDAIVAYNEYGRSQVLAHRPDLKKKLYVIPHGADTKTFYPLGVEKLDFRESFFGKHAHKFIIINCNRNQHRKDIPATVFAFQEFHKTVPNSFLYLHMHPNDPMGWDIRALMRSMELREGRDYAFPPVTILQRGEERIEDYQVEAATLNKIYNACDVYFTSTRGEGWGLSVVEAMCCMLPVICPDNTSLTEIAGNGRAYLLENQYPIASRADSMIRGQIDPEEAAETLKYVHNQTEYENFNPGCSDIFKKTNTAHNYAKSLSWQNIVKKWAELFKEIY